jgi:hypothetical protein
MPPESQSSPEREPSVRKPLPFEPSKGRKKPEQQVPLAAAKTKDSNSGKVSQDRRSTRTTMEIPDVVSHRMAQRMALFCGVPSLLGLSTFFVSYLSVTQNWVDLPNVVVVLVSIGFFGLGVLGLSYGVISASWDEEVPGSKLGWSEFTTNFGRLTEAWRSPDKKS